MLNNKAFLSKKIFSRDIEKIPTRDGYGDGVVVAAKKDENIVVLCCDLTESTRSLNFKKLFPERFIQVGIAEQNMLSISAGLALEGKIPFASSYAVFNPGRNWDQLRVSVCYNNANVKIIGAHAGLSVGPDGATHQALEDIAIARVLPRLTVIVPCDYNETKKAIIESAKFKGPVYIRFAREKTPSFTTDRTPFKIGKAEILWQSKNPQVTITACGPLVYEALLAAKNLEKEKIGTVVINNHTIKPLDEKTLLSCGKKTKGIITVEEHQVYGGLFSAVTELFAQHYPILIEPVAVMDCFGESGTPDELMKKFGLLAENIEKKIKTLLKK